MATGTLNDCTELDTRTLERVNYFPRQLLTADDMTADQQYILAKLRRHNRYLHGWGVVCGMEVSVAPTAKSPWQVQIGAGYALGPYGDEIFIPNPVMLDLAQCGPGASTDPCDPGSLLRDGVSTTGATLFLAVRYEECFSRPVRVIPGSCGCNESSCEPSRISDSFEIECLSELPPSSQPGSPGPLLCDIISGQALAPCPSCPTDPWVVLAQVTLPASTGTAIPQEQVDNITSRRKLFSTAAIQEQVRLCCCTAADNELTVVTDISPQNGTHITDAGSAPPAVAITFSKNLQPSTVNPSTILVQRANSAGGPSESVQGTVAYVDASRSAIFTPTLAFTIPGVYTVTALGSGPNHIVDVDNLALDGDKNTVAGGNFTSSFIVFGPQPTGTPIPSYPPAPTYAPVPTYAPNPIYPPVPPDVVVPLTATVTGPNPIPTINAVASALVGELQLIINGGTPGQMIQFTADVTLSVNLGTPAIDTALWTDNQGNQISAIPSPNGYSFHSVKITLPPASGSVKVKIANMKANTLAALQFGAGQVNALVSIAGAPMAVNNPNQVVAKLARG